VPAAGLVAVARPCCSALAADQIGAKARVWSAGFRRCEGCIIERDEMMGI
jgi:hypothetical protein